MKKFQNSPSKLLNYRFAVTPNGYSPEEVDALLDSIIADYLLFKYSLEILENKNNELHRELAERRIETDRLNRLLTSGKENELKEMDRFSNLSLIQKIAHLEKRIKDLEQELANKK